jgi:PPOX class probable F420-dependent enzyme
MDTKQALEAVRPTHQSVLVTMRRNGRPQLSNVLHTVGEDGVVRVSITTDRAKYANLRREPWAALHVDAGSFWSWVVVEGDVELSPVAAQPDDATVDELVDYFRSINGEHEDWDAYRAAMVAEQRLVVRLTPHRAYGSLG